MKYVLVIGDGMADAPVAQLDGKTPMEALTLDAFDRVAGGDYGRVRTVPEGLVPGSDTAILSIFGNDPRTCYTGRSVLEAAGMGITVPQGSVSLRVNLCAVEERYGRLVILSHNGGGIHGKDAETLMRDLTAAPSPFASRMSEIKLDIHITDTFRHIGVMQAGAVDLASVRLTEPHGILDHAIEGHYPACTGDHPAALAMCAGIADLMRLSYEALKDHPINVARREKGLLPANMVWPWGAATAMQLDSFTEKYHKTGSVISAVPLVWGIASLAGLKTPRVKGANGELDTNYQGKVDAVLHALDSGDDFAAVHIEAPDEMAHAGEMIKKMRAIQNVNDLVTRPLLEALDARGEDYRLLLMCDHPTLLTTRGHDGTPVPFAIYDSRRPGSPRKYSESAAKTMPLLDDGSKLLERLFSVD
ncbi:MAG TPA: 2,3-bisphosphoglycerate-independent phosphoglycerate mutase [Candidatus Limiplasma sp.]|nr:2,3-bisphosphoglycerate-independent phosphoglycerate mutase [Candidatus Limiplasma sp.]